jgi:hypothetical protein
MTLEAYISEALEKPFVWGQHDCILFTIGWLNIRTGKNWLAAFPAWSSKREAVRIVAQLGGLEAEFDRRLKRIPPSAAKDGDIGIFGKTAVLFYGPNIVAPGLDGFEFTNRTKATCAWSY